MFNFDLGAFCRRVLENQDIYWKVERKYQEIQARSRRSCRNCLYFNDNSYLPCAVAPNQAERPDEDNNCSFFERLP
jgi:hypothetical protein